MKKRVSLIKRSALFVGMMLLMMSACTCVAQEIQPELTPQPTAEPLIVGDWQVQVFTPVNEIELLQDAQIEQTVETTNALENPQRLRLVAYQGSEERVELPESLVVPVDEGEERELLVVELGAEAFRENRNLKSVSIPDTVLTIGDGAFYRCRALEQVRLPAKLEKLNNDVFNGCAALEAIEIPLSVTTIGYGAFEGCKMLNNVILPDNVDTVRGNAFKDCAALSEIELSRRLNYIGGHAFQHTPWLAAQDDEFVIVGDNVLLAYNGKDRHVVIPENVLMIVDAFEGYDALESVELPPDLTRIGCNAFARCTRLETLELPSTVRALDEYALADCVNLTQLVLPEAVTYIGSYAFKNCRSLTELAIPGNVTQIDSRAFSGCKKIKAFDLPEGIREIGSDTFANCTALERVRLPYTLETIAETAFRGTGMLELELVYGSVAERFAQRHALPYSYMIQYNDEFAYMRHAQGIEIVDYLGVSAVAEVPTTIDNVNVYAIGVGAFQDVADLVEVTLPEGVQQIGEWAFSYSENLERVELPETAVALGADAFRGCTSLMEVYLPDSVAEVGQDAFADCPQVVILADSGSLASEEARKMNLNTIDPLLNGTPFRFEKRENALALTGYVGQEAQIDLPLVRTQRAVDTIAQGAFAGNGVISEVNVPDGYRTIESRAFSDIAGELVVTLPDSIVHIEDDAFSGTQKITLRGHSGTQTESFARRNGLKFLVIHE